ncbi:ATP-dependent DNA helicase RecQ [Niabella terrae]
MSAIAREILREYFGFDGFRPLQQEIIDAVLQGHDTLALLPTGGGKSLCYQIPGLAREGLCLVVSPLIALMQDQVRQLRQKNITALMISTGMSRAEITSVLETACRSNCKFLYVSPERLDTALFRSYLEALDIRLIAVDEAHCISQWGYDFRPAYLRIAALRTELPGIPLIALTASATPVVQQDICDKLQPPDSPVPTPTEEASAWRIFKTSFERPELSYRVLKIGWSTEERMDAIHRILEKTPGPAIVFCSTRKRTREIAEALSRSGITAQYYNAGLSTEERSKRQQQWISNQLRVMVCTNAFGMGIDKPDVRLVVHADPPDSLENYYQEAGRAGRDGAPAVAVLLYNQGAIEFLNRLPELRYPPLNTIRQVYRSAVHYLQLPEGEAPGTSYDFNLKDFIQKFGLDIQTTVYGLKALEQDGWLSFSEQVFKPPQLRFNMYKEVLYEYESSHPTLEPLIKSLLRSYEGIYDNLVTVSESYLARQLRIDSAQLLQQLQLLARDRVIVFEPRKTEAQLMLMRPRIKTALLEINLVQHRERKAWFQQRLQAMIDYLQETDSCRNKIICSYFGQTGLEDCGRCDNCRKVRQATE